jgi:hypothetical protein
MIEERFTVYPPSPKAMAGQAVCGTRKNHKPYAVYLKPHTSDIFFIRC